MTPVYGIQMFVGVDVDICVINLRLFLQNYHCLCHLFIWASEFSYKHTSSCTCRPLQNVKTLTNVPCGNHELQSVLLGLCVIKLQVLVEK